MPPRDTSISSSTPSNISTSSRNGPSRSTTYTYDPIDTSTRQIRLLQVKPRLSSTLAVSIARGPISCTISTFPADAAPPYVAVSYTWGSPSKTRNILLNNQGFIVRKNLYDFLDSYSTIRSERQRYLWIDQLCIDQSNNSERNHQVGIMADIYRNSDFVVAWLDTSSYKAAKRLKKAWFADSDGTEALLKNEYFSRLWVVQEQLLARRLYFLCGDIWLKWNKVRRGVVNMKKYSFARFEELPNAKYLFVGTKRKRNRQPKFDPKVGEISLHHCVVRYSKLKCEDPKDKIYGLIGMLNNVPDAPVPDYNKPLQQVYLDAVQHLIAHPGHCSPERIAYDARGLAGDMLDMSDEMTLKVYLDDLVNLGTVGAEVPVGWIPPTNVYGMRHEPQRWWFEHQGQRFDFVEGQRLGIAISDSMLPRASEDLGFRSGSGEMPYPSV